MHICHIVHRPRLSGAEVLASGLSRKHVERGYECSFVATRPAERSFQSTLEELALSGVRISAPLADQGRLSRVLSLRRTLLELSPSVIFSHSVLPAFLTRLALVGLSTPCVTVLHSGLSDYYGVLRVLESILPSPAGVVGVTECNCARYRSQFAIRGPCVAIPNGIDLGKFQRARNTRTIVRATVFQAAEDETLFLQVGRLAAAKQLELSIAAFERLRIHHRSKRAKLVFVGSDEDRDVALAVRSAHVRRPDEILWLGPRDDVPELLAACDVCLMPSRWEAHPIALLEALAAGCSVIANDIPAFQFAREYPGVHFATTPEAFADLMANQNPDQTHNRDLSNWDLDKCSARYEEFATKLLAPASAPKRAII